MSLRAKFLLVLMASAVMFLTSPLTLQAMDFGGLDISAQALKRVTADHWDVVGKNVIFKGNVHVPGKEVEIFADQVVLNLESKDLEASGNIRFQQCRKINLEINPGDLPDKERDLNTRLEVTGISADIWGKHKLQVSGVILGDSIRATRLVGNMESGYFSFENGLLNFKNFICKAKQGERCADGVIRVRQAEFSGCSYLESDNAHYSISANEATLTPYQTSFYGLADEKQGYGDYSVFMQNSFIRAYGMPVLWLPCFYKPRDQKLGLFGIQVGKTSDWGFFLRTYKRIDVLDYPYISLKLLADFYAKRGFGYGATGEITTENSRTDFFAYSIYDTNQYRTEDYDKYRIDVPHYRYDFRVTHVTHITPRLDLRAQFEKLSDPYVTNDFFSARFDQDPRPATFVALEQQFDRLSAYLYVRPKVNSFFTTVQQLPSFGFEAPRQQIFNTNFYYQGDLKGGYLKMDWLDFDEKLKDGRENKLKNYDVFRLDTTHFLYYPLRLDWLTLVPRIGGKMTVYSDSSKEKVKDEDVFNMAMASDLENLSAYDFKNYDRRGGAKVRFAGELGIEASTKIYRSWQDIKSAFFQVDGLRHVVRPYINYTFIPEPTEDREHLYYFDDTDRLTKQHFVRFGLENRLQTRNGDNSIKNLITMENYWDLYIESANGMNQIGNFCTTLTAEIFKGFTLSTGASIDVGNNNGKLEEVNRNGRPGGYPGLQADWLNKWTINLTYKPIDDVTLAFGYLYERPYQSRSAYSMGSTLSQFESGRNLDKYYTDYSQELYGLISFPLTMDRRTLFQFRTTYDIYMGAFDTFEVRLMRKFHCFTAALQYMAERDYKEKEYDHSIAFTVELTSLNALTNQTGNEKLAYGNNMFR